MNSLLLWLAVAVTTALADMAWTLYFIQTEKRHATKAAFWSAFIVALGCFTTVQFVDNHWLATATIAGGFVGTWLTVKFNKK